MIKFNVIVFFLIIFTLQIVQNIQNENYSIFRVLSPSESQKNKESVCDLLEGEIEDGKVVSPEQEESWYYNKQTIKKSRSKNYLDEYAQGNDDALMDFLIHLGKQVGIFVVFFIFSIFGCIGYWFYCLCNCICPPCKLCCKCCQRERLYTGIELHWPLLGNAIFLIWILVICIYGLSYSSALQNSFNTFICAALTAFDGLAYGGGSFSGIYGVKNSLSDFSETQLGLIQQETQNTFTGVPEWVTLEKTEMDYISGQMKVECTGGDCVECTGQSYTNTQPQLVIDNSPVCPANSWVPYVSTFQYSSPVQDSVFFSDEIWGTQVDGAIALYEGAVSGITAAIQAIEESGQNINDQQDSMKDTIDAGIEQMTSLEETITSQMDTILQYHTDYKTYMELVSMGVQYLLIGFIVFSVLASIIIVIIQLKQWFKLRIFLHCCWALFSLLMIITYLLTIILMSISFGGEQVCEISFKMFNNPDQFQLYASQLPEDLVDKVMICKRELNLVTGPYQGDDNLAKAFGIESQLKSISDLKDQIYSFEDQAGTDSENMQTLESVPAELDTLITNLDNLRATFEFEGTLDATNLQTTLDNIDTTLTGCGFTDIYVTDKTLDCGSLTYSDFNPDPGAGSFCFHVEDSYVNSRFGSCPAAETDIASVELWRDHKNDMVDLKKIQTQHLKAQLELFIDLHKSYIQSVTDFNTVVISALDAIAGDDGILNSIKCFWFGSQIDNFNDALCVSFINSCYNIGFVFGFFSFGLFFSSFFLYIYAQRMAFNAYNIKKLQVFTPIQQQQDKEIENMSQQQIEDKKSMSNRSRKHSEQINSQMQAE